MCVCVVFFWGGGVGGAQYNYELSISVFSLTVELKKEVTIDVPAFYLKYYWGEGVNPIFNVFLKTAQHDSHLIKTSLNNTSYKTVAP